MSLLFALLGIVATPASAPGAQAGATPIGTSASTIERASRGARPPLPSVAEFRAKRPGKRYSVTVPIGNPKPAVALPRIEGPDNSLSLIHI